MFKKTGNRYKTIKLNLSPIEQEFLKIYDKVPTKRELEQYLPRYNQKHKIEKYDKTYTAGNEMPLSL